MSDEAGMDRTDRRGAKIEADLRKAVADAHQTTGSATKSLTKLDAATKATAQRLGKQAEATVTQLQKQLASKDYADMVDTVDQFLAANANDITAMQNQLSAGALSLSSVVVVVGYLREAKRLAERL